jgi:hypothetical protein
MLEFLNSSFVIRQSTFQKKIELLKYSIFNFQFPQHSQGFHHLNFLKEP